MSVTVEGLKDAMTKLGERLTVHNCSFCHYPCGFLMENGGLYYDSGCDCVRGGYNVRPCADSELEFYLVPEHGHIPKLEEFIRAASIMSGSGLSCGLEPWERGTPRPEPEFWVVRYKWAYSYGAGWSESTQFLTDEEAKSTFPNAKGLRRLEYTETRFDDHT
jgi:hypothetical protein